MIRWEEAGEAYLSESWKRQVMWYVKDDSKLGMLDTDQKYRLEHTLQRTAVSRKLLAFQVSIYHHFLRTSFSQSIAAVQISCRQHSQVVCSQKIRLGIHTHTQKKKKKTLSAALVICHHVNMPI